MDCPSDVLRALLAQYEALTLLKDLSVQADLARYKWRFEMMKLIFALVKITNGKLKMSKSVFIRFWPDKSMFLM